MRHTAAGFPRKGSLEKASTWKNGARFTSDWSITISRHDHLIKCSGRAAFIRLGARASEYVARASRYPFHSEVEMSNELISKFYSIRRSNVLNLDNTSIIRRFELI